MLLAIETSCDETAVALIDPDLRAQKSEEFLKADLISSQHRLHEPFGGVVPELAAREHNINLPLLVREALKAGNTDVSALTGVAVTRGPGLKGCLLVGIAFAKALAGSRNIPLLALNHMEGHIFAADLMGPESRLEYPFVALVVSGGHTMLVHSPSFRRYSIVAQTRDDAAGEAFDKVATLLGLSYPGGPALARTAERGNRTAFRFPVGLPQDPTSFSFSGLKTAVQRTVQQLGSQVTEDETVANLAASVQHAIVRALVEKSVSAARILKPKAFVLTGGVAANQSLRAELAQALEPLGVRYLVPKARWCTDNAAMIGLLGKRIIEKDRESYVRWADKPAAADGLIGPELLSSFGALPRWPLDRLHV